VSGAGSPEQLVQRLLGDRRLADGTLLIAPASLTPADDDRPDPERFGVPK
jgi:hypothetical protein